MKKIIVYFSLLIILVACVSQDKNEEVNVKKEGINMQNPIATITFKDLGEMKFELQIDEAPQSVYNFTSLANQGFYDGLSMHRIIKDFVAQGGDPQGTGTGGPGYSIKGEFRGNRVENNTGHSLGALAFARSQIRDSAGSQFYIVLTEFDKNMRDYMDNDYAAFGLMIEGRDVLDKINNEYATTAQDGTPLKALTVDTIVVDTHGESLPEPDKLK